MYFDKYKLRDKNEKIVLESLIAHQPISRASLSKITTLNKASITNIINTFIDRKLIQEIGYGESQNMGGRRPILLEMNRDAGTVIAVDVGNDYLSAIITNLNGTVLNRIDFNDEHLEIDGSNVDELVAQVVDHFQETATKTVYGVVAMVLAVHGVVFNNHITLSPNYNLIGHNLHTHLNASYAFPVILENEANLAALAHISVSHEITNAVLMSIHTGIGAGIIIDRNLYTGKQGAAGEVGHLTLYPHGLECRCGRHGCLEKYASSKVVYDAFHHHFPDVPLNHDVLAARYHDNAPFQQAVNAIMLDLVTGLNTLVSHFDPEIIYIVSDVLVAIPTLVDLLQSNLNTLYNHRVPIQLSNIQHGATLMGGASLGIAEFLGTERYILNKSAIKNNS